MFDFISEILTNIANFFSTVWNFIINVFREIVYIIEILTTTLINMPSYFVWLPATITILLTTALAIIVIYKIMGRD